MRGGGEEGRREEGAGKKGQGRRGREEGAGKKGQGRRGREEGAGKKGQGRKKGAVEGAEGVLATAAFSACTILPLRKGRFHREGGGELGAPLKQRLLLTLFISSYTSRGKLDRDDLACLPITRNPEGEPPQPEASPYHIQIWKCIVTCC